jgi:hypothetical protein
MKIYATEYISLHRITKEPVLMEGPCIEAESQAEAQQWADIHFEGHLTVIGEINKNLTLLANMEDLWFSDN